MHATSALSRCNLPNHHLFYSSRNSTGHWRANCRQADISNFNLLLRPGYARSECDCMRCDVVGNAPFVIRDRP